MKSLSSWCFAMVRGHRNFQILSGPKGEKVCGRPRDKGGEPFLDGPLQRMRCAKWLNDGNCFQTGFKGAKKATVKVSL